MTDVQAPERIWTTGNAAKTTGSWNDEKVRHAPNQVEYVRADLTGWRDIADHPLPEDGTPVLLWDGLSVFAGRYILPCTLEDFLTFCDDWEGEVEWKEYDAEMRADDEVLYDEWSLNDLTSDDCILSAEVIKWKPITPPEAKP